MSNTARSQHQRDGENDYSRARWHGLTRVGSVEQLQLQKTIPRGHREAQRGLESSTLVHIKGRPDDMNKKEPWAGVPPQKIALVYSRTNLSLAQNEFFHQFKY